MAEGERAIIFEFQTFGTTMRVVAVDELTGIEVTIIAPANSARHDVQRLATAKLKLALKRAGEGVK